MKWATPNSRKRPARSSSAAAATSIASCSTASITTRFADKDHVHSVGSHNGCEIDQVFGQSWAFQVGLGRILPEGNVKKALAALWKYNFAPDVGPFRKAHKPGRWYAMAGEAGLIMCTWPQRRGGPGATGL